MTFIWPLALIVLANTLYQVCAKGIPKDMNIMASMFVTYLVGALCSLIMFFVMPKDGGLAGELAKTNYAPVLLGACVVGLEVGFIYAYKVGWAVSTLSIAQSAFLAVTLLILGAAVYHEVITLNKVIGAGIILLGLYFINK